MVVCVGHFDSDRSDRWSAVRPGIITEHLHVEADPFVWHCLVVKATVDVDLTYKLKIGSAPGKFIILIYAAITPGYTAVDKMGQKGWRLFINEVWLYFDKAYTRHLNLSIPMPTFRHKSSRAIRRRNNGITTVQSAK